LKPKFVFPKDFEWGAATASYQIECGWDEGGKGENIRNRFTHTPVHVDNATNGDVACDFCHRYEEDVALAETLGLRAFRLSVSRARVMPEGAGRVCEEGVPAEGYHVRTFTDRFKRAYGTGIRLGRVQTDYAARRRIVKDSARRYADVIRNGGYNPTHTEG
jgi:beta-glucosidase/6-phospho-beta-glucosidase/beta-galactosidase